MEEVQSHGRATPAVVPERSVHVNSLEIPVVWCRVNTSSDKERGNGSWRVIRDTGDKAAHRAAGAFEEVELSTGSKHTGFLQPSNRKE